MIKSKKLISILLSLALLVSSIFVAGAVTSVDLDSLDSITNTYDEADRGITFKNYSAEEESFTGNIATSVLVDGEEVMYSSTKPLFFAAWGAQVQPVTEEMGTEQGNAVRFTEAVSYPTSGDTSYYSVVRVYEDTNSKLVHYAPNANTTYEVKLKYYVSTAPSKEILLQVRQSQYQELDYYKGNDDIGEEVTIVSITEATNGWQEAYMTYTTSADPDYMSIALVSATSGAASNVDVWIDDVVVSECINITAHNYDAVSDKAVPVSKNTTIADIQVPEVAGYRFCGIYADAEYATKLDTSLQAGLYTDLYFKWEPLTLGQFYCGFEDYKPQSTAMSYNTDVVTIGGEATYVGSKALKATLTANGLTAFELRNDSAFEIVAGTQYTVTFAYNANTDVEIYAGIGKAGDVPGTAEALAGMEATGDGTWKTATLTVTPDKGTADGYAIAMLLYTENAAEIYIDDVLVSGPEQGYENPEINTNFDDSWYPNLALFEGIELPDPPEIWGGTSDLSQPADTDSDGVYEINNGAELAYVIVNKGMYSTTTDSDGKTILDETTVKSFKLTKDIYLNDVDMINWSDGTVKSSAYTARSWYTGWNGSKGFIGTIDGDGHTVYGLYLNGSAGNQTQYSTGLIPLAGDSVTIKNLGIDNSYLNYSNGNTAAFVGARVETLYDSCVISIENCYVGENTTLSGNSVAVFRGYQQYGGATTNITNCYSLADITATSGAQGLVTTMWGTTTVKNTYTTSQVTTSANATTYMTASNVYEAVSGITISGITHIDNIANMKGTDVFTKAGKMPNLNADRAYVATEGYPVLAVHEGIEVPEIWDGSKDTVPVKNEESGAYEITNGAELAYAIYNGGTVGEETNCTFVLTKDIYLNDIDSINWETGEVLVDGYSPRFWFKNWSWNMNGANPGTNRKSDFKGTIDGNGHTVYGIYYKSNATSYAESLGYAVALIPSVPAGGTATVTNLGVDNVYINSEYSASAIIGKVGSNGDPAAVVNISNSYVGENVYLKGYNAVALCGNLFYQHATRTITNCYSLATTSSGGGNSGLISNVPYVNMSNCYNANGPITTNTYASSASFSNCYETIACGFAGVTAISNTLMQGLDVFEDGKMPNLNSANGFTAQTGYPVPTIFADELITDTEEDNEETEAVIWGGKESDVYAPTYNEELGAYEITNGAELAYIIANKGVVDEASGHTFVLTNDIYLNNLDKINWATGATSDGYTANWWYSSGNTAGSTGFVGTIDGDGHTVYGLYYKSGSHTKAIDHSSALIPVAGGDVTVKNLAIDYSYINYESNAGAFIGATEYSGMGDKTINIEGCYVGKNTYIEGCNVAVFKGYQQNTGVTTNITNCYSLAEINAVKVDGSNGAQGLVTTIWGTTTIKNTYTTSQVSTSTSTANIVATNVYEGIKSGADDSGITYIDDLANMKGEDVLTNSAKMSGLASAYAFVPTYLDFADHDYYIYLPAGTIFTKDLQPTFYDTFFMSVDKADILLANTMVSGAYVKFAVEPTAADIKVPTALANFVHQGTLAEISAMDYQTEYYGIQSEIVSQQLDKQSDEAVNYIFITDIHYNGENTETGQGAALLKQMQLVVKMANAENSNIDFIAIGGDIIEGTNTKTNAISYIQTILAPLADSTKPVFVMSGNHDDNSYGSWAAYIGQTNYDAGYSDDSYFAADKLISKYEWNTSVIGTFVTPTVDSNKFSQHTIDGVPQRYYYYDLVKGDKTTRIFVLDAIDYAVGSYNDNGSINELLLEDGKTEADEATVPTAGTTLQYRYKMGASEYIYSDAQIEWLEDSLKAGGYDEVIFLSHMGIDAETSGVSTNGDKLRAVISDFNNKTGNLADTDGKILSYQFGHIHAERELYSADIDLWQLCTSTAKAEQAGKSGAPWRALTYSMGTESEACFDIMSVSPTGIVKMNIGAGTDHNLISYLKLPAGDVNTDETADICDLVKLHNIANSTAKTTTVDVNKDNIFAVAVDAAALRKLLIGAN